MNEDIILITAYCPDNQKIDKLRKLVNQLQKFKNKYDIMVVSHTTIPLDIQENLDLCLYDKKNELLTDWDLINQPWFSPGNGRKIQSGLLTGRNTHLAIWRMFILSFSMCKNIGYKKIHQIEYDCEIKNDLNFNDNSNLLEEYDFIYYKDKQKDVDEILFGSFQSYKVEKIPNELLILNEDELKNKIRTSYSKSPEGMLEDILIRNGKVKVKDRNNLEFNGNKFATSVDDNGFNPWGVPFVDLLNDELKFVCWNQKKKEGVNNIIIINNDKVFNTGNVNYGTWLILNLGSLKDVNKITVIEDDILRNTFIVDTSEKKKLFKKQSFQVQ